MQRHPEIFDRLVPVTALVSTLGLLAAVFYLADATNNYWEYNVTFDVGTWMAMFLAGAGILRYFAPAHAAGYFVAAVVIYLLVGAGPGQSIAAVVLVFSCYWYGRFALNCMFRKPRAGWTATPCILVGLALLLALFGVMIHYTVNYRSVYFAIVLAPLLLLFFSGRLLPHWHNLQRDISTRATATTLPYWLVVLTTILLGVICRLALFPTVFFDDNALHLGMWTQLSYRHVYGFDVVTQIWEVAPFAVDLLHAILSMLAGEDARSALNLFFLAFLLRQLWVILRHFALTESDRLLIILLFVSTPLVGNQLASLQTELFLALLMTSGTRLVLDADDGWNLIQSAAILAVAAMCCATKLPGAYMGALLVFAAVIKLWSTRDKGSQPLTLVRGILIAGFICALGVLAFNSYFTAWRITGNPLFPLYNGIFKSPYYEAVNFSDSRWILGFSFMNYLRAFFSTSLFFETQDFVAGFQYLFLLPLGIIVMLKRVSLATVCLILLPLLGFGLVMFSVTQYLRYLFPVIPLAAAVIGILLARGQSDNRMLAHGSRLAIVMCMMPNLYFYPGIVWLFQLPASSAYNAEERAALIESYAPVRALNSYLNEQAPGSRVLYPEETPHGATLNGEPVYVTWYSPSVLARASLIRTEADVATFLEEEQIDFVITYTADGSKPGSAKWLLREYLSHAGFPEQQIGEYFLYRVLDHDILYQPVPGTVAEPGSRADRLPVSLATDVVATELPLLLTTVSTGAARSARYRVDFRCAENAGYFIAQLNWDVGAPYYRLVPCTGDVVNFVESFPVPAGAAQADVYVTAWGTGEVTVNSLTIEIN